jgi:hypothetical protein
MQADKNERRKEECTVEVLNNLKGLAIFKSFEGINGSLLFNIFFLRNEGNNLTTQTTWDREGPSVQAMSKAFLYYVLTPSCL